MDSNKNNPNPMITIPPIWFNPDITSPDAPSKTLLMITPKVENTTENPRTKNIVFKIIFVLLIVMVFVLFF